MNTYLGRVKYDVPYVHPDGGFTSHVNILSSVFHLYFLSSHLVIQSCLDVDTYKASDVLFLCVHVQFQSIL